MPKRFILATDDKGRPRYVAVDCVDIVIAAAEGGRLLKASDGKILGAAKAENFDLSDYED